MDWLSVGKTRGEMVLLFDEKHVRPRSADRYIAIARERLQAQVVLDDRQAARAMLLHELRGDVELMKGAEAFGALATTRRTMAQVTGAFAPEQHEHRGAIAHVAMPAGPEQLDLSVLSDEERRVYDRAIGKLEARHALPAASGEAIEGEVVEVEPES